MIEAACWTPGEGGAALCALCPRRCRIAPGGHGFCRVRSNRNGVLTADTWELPAAVAIDPIEKKPLYHFLPGSKAFSIGTAGCNLGCVFCQNDSLSRHGVAAAARRFAPELLADAAVEHHCASVALTYNEPTVFFEYAVAIAKAARARGLKVILVTNGYINPEPRAELYNLADAANIDVKGFGEFYPTMCQAELAPVLASCEYFKNHLHRHLEITNLVIPGKNDAPEQVDALLDWAAERLGLETPLHFSAYHPAAQCHIPPTPRATVLALKERAERRGFRYVHPGNI